LKLKRRTTNRQRNQNPCGHAHDYEYSKKKISDERRERIRATNTIYEPPDKIKADDKTREEKRKKIGSEKFITHNARSKLFKNHSRRKKRSEKKKEKSILRKWKKKVE